MIPRAILLLAPLAVLCGQTPAHRKEFEVASIKPSVQTAERVNVGVHIDGAQVRCNMLSIKDYVAMAYQLKHHQIVGPEWIAGERFDIAAKIPDGAARDDVREMIQSLLADRFQMKVHRDKKDYPVYALIQGKGGIKMKEAPLDAEPEAGGRGAVNVSASGGRGGTTVNFGRGASFSFADNKLAGKKLTMVQFAETLARFMDRPVVDQTELPGTYDFTLEFTQEDYTAMLVRSAISAGVVLPPEAMRALQASGDSLFAAVQSLGLKLDSRKAPIDVLVIDSILKAPTEN